MIKVKLVELVNSVQVLSQLAAMKLPITTTLKLRRVMKALGEPLKDFDEARNALMDEYCKPIEDGAQSRPFKSEKDGKKFTKELETVSNEEITLLIQTMKIKDFGIRAEDLDSAEKNLIFTTNDLMTLEWLVPDEGEAETNPAMEDIQELEVEPAKAEKAKSKTAE